MLQGLKNGYLFQFAVFTTIKDNAFLSASNCPCISKTRSHLFIVSSPYSIGKNYNVRRTTGQLTVELL